MFIEIIFGVITTLSGLNINSKRFYKYLRVVPKVVILNLFQDLIAENKKNVEIPKQSAAADGMTNGVFYNFGTTT